ncbi:hypothetical protein AB0B45_15555 [Nonomuraea sp. NPDC049152]|uniref:hypothetical protein n=1 Tax=Nonomuraea sp. NPDC049152 TaxID=3154350 RepID=UPI0033F22C97
MIDIYSRYVVHWEVHARENAELAEQFVAAASVHLGTAGQIRAERARTLQAAYAANPGRFRRKPTPFSLSKAVWINEPVKEETNSDTEQVA